MQLFHQTNVPVNQNLLYKTAEAAKNALCGDLDIHCDENTGFVYNSAFNVNLLNYSEEYNNNQYYSSFFSKYIDEQIEWLIRKYIHQSSTIIEVGCGKGYFSKIIADKLPACEVYGFDTSYVQLAEENPPNLHIFKEYYNENYAYLRPDAIICRHVIEHIHKPVDFLSSIRASMPENALLFLETPDVNWILKNNVIFDFFYEHCSYFNISSIDSILSISGFETVEAKHTFNGQYMWIAARAVNRNGTTKNKQNTLALCRKFKNNREKKMNSVSKTLKILAQKEKTMFVWGAGAKGVTFVNLFDSQQKYISALIDINPDKQGRYVGIASHEVISAETLSAKCSGGGGGGGIKKNYK
jgi:2-polyprenyl-3-methyl-5-hydroxy-6-metoxy-1,4-benzoquinol methylase